VRTSVSGETQRFEDLMDEEQVYGPPANPRVFSIAKAKEEVIKHKQEQKEELESALNSNAKKTNDNSTQQGGKRLTKSYRASKQNYTKKLRRTMYS
jgi:hypothetical protein